MNIFEPFRAIVSKFRPVQKKHTGDYVRRPRYSVSVINLSSLATVFTVRGRKWSFIALAVLLFLLIGGIWTVTFLYTPVGNLLPMKLSNNARDQYVEMAVRVDSISRSAAVNERYYSNLYSVIYDTVPETPAQPHPSIPDIQDIPLDSLMRASDAERRFVERFEAAERYNLSVLSPLAANGMNFYSPVPRSGLDHRVADDAIPQVLVTPGKTTPLSAVYRGTVINTYYSTGRGVTVVIQHPNDFVSEYSGLTDVFVKRGDKVNAGQRIGMAQEGAHPLAFELWHNGTPLDATDYIEF